MALEESILARLKAYCRMDDLVEGENLLLEEMYNAAVSYMEDAGVSKPSEEDKNRLAKYNLCIDALVLDAWDARGTQTMGQSLVDNPAFRRRLNQLKWTEPVSDSDTGIGE